MDFKNKLFLLPMADVTGSQFRILCKKYGADIVCTELISVNAIVRNNERTNRLIFRTPIESPVGIQLFGTNPEIIKEAAIIVRDNFDFIDFNLGCPSVKITNQGAGASLLKRKNKVEEILRALISGAGNKPVTIKMRSGFDEKHLSYNEIGKIAEDCGVAAIAMHGRTAVAGYSDNYNWDWIKELKETVNVPVIGNGNIVSGESCKQMFEQTKCDSIMVGRAAIGYPFIFREIKAYLKDGNKLEKASIKERLETYLSIGKNLDFSAAKQHALWFTSGLEGSAQMRVQISSFRDYAHIEKYFKKIIEVSE